MSDESDILARRINRLADEISKAVSGVAIIGVTVVCAVLAVIAAYALYFGYGWATKHLPQVGILAGTCAFWITANWRK